MKIFQISTLVLVLSCVACCKDCEENAPTTNNQTRPQCAPATQCDTQKNKASSSKDTLDAETKAYSVADLFDTEWKPTFLIDAENLKMPPPNSPEAVKLRINKNMRVNGISGDNLFGGELTALNSGFFKLQRVYSTRRAGPYGEYEQKFLNALNNTNRFELDGDKLSLFQDNTLLVQFKKYLPTK